LLRDLDNRGDEDGTRTRVTFVRWLLLGLAVNFRYISRNFRERYVNIPPGALELSVHVGIENAFLNGKNSQ
jgi:hypothetical protein